MTATTHTVVVRPPSTFSPQKHLGGSYLLTTAALTSIAALDETSTVDDVLAILSVVTEAQHEVTSDSIGFATSVLT